MHVVVSMENLCQSIDSIDGIGQLAFLRIFCLRMTRSSDQFARNCRRRRCNSVFSCVEVTYIMLILFCQRRKLSDVPFDNLPESRLLSGEAAVLAAHYNYIIMGFDTSINIMQILYSLVSGFSGNQVNTSGCHLGQLFKLGSLIQ